MSALDAATAAEHAVRLGLVTPDQVQEAWDELGRRSGDGEEFVRVMQRKGFLTPWQSTKLLKNDKSGYFVGGYRILYRISAGSFGRVYRAEDPNTGQVVAIKALRQQLSDNKHMVELFQREGKMGMAIRHPNVVQILSVNHDEAANQHYIVMEFVEGGNLRDFLGIRKKLEPLEAVRIMEGAAAGLSYAFSRGFSHRDIKPTNILISSQGTAKLVDFGLAETSFAAARDDNSQVDRTVDYAGLEMATNVTPGDVRSDIFFLGCVMYEMLTGRPPLPPTKDPKERMKRERFSNVPKMVPGEVNGPPALFRLVETMMSVNPEQRYQTPTELCDALREARREIEGKPAGKASTTKSVFVVEKDQRLQDALREKFKESGYRVFIAADPSRALDRYRQQPFDALLIDAGTAGEDGLLLFDRVLAEAKRQRSFCAGILILSEDQRDWVDRVEAREAVSILVRPVSMKQLKQELAELFALES